MPGVDANKQAGAAPPARAGGAIRVLVVDDSAFVQRALGRMLTPQEGFEVVGVASNGREALALLDTLRPDVMTLDVEMPVLDGLATLRRLRGEGGPAPSWQPAVLMCSSLTSAGSHEALAALSLGAADVIAKDASSFSLGLETMRAELLAKVRAVAASRRLRRGAAAGAPAAGAAGAGASPARTARLATLRGVACDAVLIGSSTGGPPALEQVLMRLPADLPVPVVVAQHMPAMFTRSLAQRLDAMCAVSVVHAEPGMKLHPGTVYIGEGGRHVRLARGAGNALTIEVSDQPASALYKPSVNELFSSGAKRLPGRCVLAVLTGMGDDGMLGAREAKGTGCVVLAQDFESSVVYGMPKAVSQAGLADASLPPDRIGMLLATLGSSGGAQAA